MYVCSMLQHQNLKSTYCTVHGKHYFLEGNSYSTVHTVLFWGGRLPLRCIAIALSEQEINCCATHLSLFPFLLSGWGSTEHGDATYSSFPSFLFFLRQNSQVLERQEFLLFGGIVRIRIHIPSHFKKYFLATFHSSSFFFGEKSHFLKTISLNNVSSCFPPPPLQHDNESPEHLYNTEARALCRYSLTEDGWAHPTRLEMTMGGSRKKRRRKRKRA